MRPAQTTVNKLKARKGEGSYRDLARELGYEESAIAMLNDVIREKPNALSLEKENELRKRLGMSEITEGGYPARRRKLDRPYASNDQMERKAALGVEWDIVIERGLQYLEKLRRNTEDPDWDESDEPALPKEWVPPTPQRG